MSLAIIADPWFWGVAVLAVTMAGVSKGGLGGGVGGAATPLLALVAAPTQAAAILLPVLCVMDLAGLKAYLGRWDRRLLRVLLPAGLLGCALGTATFRQLDDSWIRVLLGTIALAFLASNLLPRRAGVRPPTNLEGYFWATLSGVTSFVAHSGGPPLMVYLLRLKLDKTVFIASSLVFFGVMNYAKILPYLWLGLFDARNLATSLVLVPVGVAGTYLGVWLQSRMNALWFYRVIHLLLLVSGSKLLYDGIRGL